MNANIIKLLQQHELVKALYDFQSQGGLTFADYKALLHISRPFSRNKATNKSIPQSPEMVFTLQGTRIGHLAAWELFLEARKDLCKLFSSKPLQLHLEDVLLLQALSATNSFQRNFKPVKPITNHWLARAFGADFSITKVLSEVSTALYLASEEKFVDFFVGVVNTKARGESFSLNDLVEFMTANPLLGKKLFGKLEEGFQTNYIPEVDIRFYNTWAAQQGDEEESNKLFSKWMREFSIADEISNCYSSPREVYLNFCHNIKNGLRPGATILYVLNRDAMEKYSEIIH